MVVIVSNENVYICQICNFLKTKTIRLNAVFGCSFQLHAKYMLFQLSLAATFVPVSEYVHAVCVRMRQCCSADLAKISIT